MESVYYDPSNPSSFGGVRPLERATGSKNVAEWLASQPTYTLHKPIRRKFPRLRTSVTTKGEQYQADLADVSSLSRYNKGYKFLLTCIDVFSRYAWVVPLKNKSGVEVTNAFKKIFRPGSTPAKLQTDQGKEFFNSTFKTYLKKKGVKLFYTKSETKCAIVERFNRTLKAKMWRYLTHKNSKTYIDALPKLVDAYNASVHRSIGIAPKDVTDKNEHLIWQKLYAKRKTVLPRYAIGDTVRVARAKQTFEKGFTQNWTEEIFKIIRVNNRDVPTYVIADANGDEIEGKFYEQELQKVVDTGTYVVEKVLERRKGKVLVKWRGYPMSMASWIPATNLKWIAST